MLAGAISVGVTVGLTTSDWSNAGQWVRDFFKSPAVAGIAAVFAAWIAYTGIQAQVTVARDARVSEESARLASSWWEMFEWASERAIPTNPRQVPLPNAVIISTLESLSGSATTDTQRAACAGVITALSESAASGNARSQSADPPTFEDDALVALESYVKSSQGTRAQSSTAESLVFENNVGKALLQLSWEHPGLHVSFEKQSGKRRLDTKVVLDGQVVEVEIKRFNSSDQLATFLRRHGRADISASIGAPLLVIAPVAASMAPEEEERLRVTSTKWNSPVDNDVLLKGLRRARALS